MQHLQRFLWGSLCSYCDRRIKKWPNVPTHGRTHNIKRKEKLAVDFVWSGDMMQKPIYGKMLNEQGAGLQ